MNIVHISLAKGKPITAANESDDYVNAMIFQRMALKKQFSRVKCAFIFLQGKLLTCIR